LKSPNESPSYVGIHW